MSDLQYYSTEELERELAWRKAADFKRFEREGFLKEDLYEVRINTSELIGGRIGTLKDIDAAIEKRLVVCAHTQFVCEKGESKYWRGVCEEVVILTEDLAKKHLEYVRWYDGVGYDYCSSNGG